MSNGVLPPLSGNPVERINLNGGAQQDLAILAATELIEITMDGKSRLFVGTLRTKRLVIRNLNGQSHLRISSVIDVRESCEVVQINGQSKFEAFNTQDLGSWDKNVAGYRAV